MHEYNLASTLLVGLFVLSLTVSRGATPAKPALAPGAPAPVFEAKDQNDKTWNLADLIGKKIVLLYFYPKDDTPGCTAEACGLRDRLGDLKKSQVEVLGASFDSADSHRAFIEKYHLNFPLLVDTEGKIADQYGARIAPTAKMTKRISFLIGLDGKIAHITDNGSAAVHLEEMQAAIKKLQS